MEENDLDPIKAKLIEAEQKAIELFQNVERFGIITAGKTENEISAEIFALAEKNVQH